MIDREGMDGLQKARLKYFPALPFLLKDLFGLNWSRTAENFKEDEKIKALFPLISGQPFLRGEKGGKRIPRPLQIGVVLSGGQAAGGHNVIIGIYDSLKWLNANSRLFGFLGGPGGIVEGRSQELTSEMLGAYRNQGGFDMIGSGRSKIETGEQLSASLAAMQEMKLDGLVIIGGDDSNTNAAVLAEYFMKNGCSTRVIGVPKTIDGDLKNAYVGTSFGFDTACKVYSEIIGNIARDASSAKKYYHFIKLMGRSASHIALECALATRPNLALIGEEIAGQKRTLTQVVGEIVDLVCKRAELGKNFGVVLIPEGLIEFIPEIAVLIIALLLPSLGKIDPFFPNLFLLFARKDWAAASFEPRSPWQCPGLPGRDRAPFDGVGRERNRTSREKWDLPGEVLSY
jgi:pyrophosphate--fructose-6-phosphate 1-phosphotransferase